MEIDKTVKITLKPKELEKLIISHLESKGFDNIRVEFDINGHNREYDDFAQLPLDYRLDSVTCYGVEKPRE